MTTLICDLNINLRGHNAGHVQYIVNNMKVKDGDTIYFLFNQSAKNIVDISYAAVDKSHFYYAPSDFSDNSVMDKLKFKEWKVIEQYASQLQIDKLFIMELTSYELQISRSKGSYKISGIKFRSSHRVSASNSKLLTRLATQVQKYKRRLAEAVLLRCKRLEDIYVLNDLTGAVLLNKQYRTNVFKYLVDPVYDYSELDNTSKTNLRHVSLNKVVYIIFGAMDWRKNIENILLAFTLTDKSIHKNISLLIVGKIPSSFKNEFKMLIKDFTCKNPDIELTINDEFVSDSKMEYYYSISDVSLVIYQKFYESSGLIGRAAKYNIISLTPNVGLMAELCKDYELGYVCDPDSPEDIEDKLLTAYGNITHNKRIDGQRFYKSHSPSRFLQLLNI
jgi:glycosyltransferase involved in cell wall biosynthesis